MMIRKSLAAFLAALILLGLLPLAMAEKTLALGDGAPIPYLKGFESRLIMDANMLPGVTGAADIRFRQEDGHTMNNQGQIAIHIQNIALTDDAIALFFRAEYPDFIPLEYGSAPESCSWAVPFVMPDVDGTQLSSVNTWREGHPDGDKVLQCLQVITLENPIPDGSALSFGDAGQVTLDKSQARDDTRAVDPMLPVKFSYERFPGQTAISYQAKIARVSFGPFGNRVLVLNRDDGRGGIDTLPCVLEDEAGNRLPVIETGYRGSSLASPVNPVETYNEVLFLGGEDMKTLRLIPCQSLETKGDKPAPVSIPLAGPFPVRAPLPGGAELTVMKALVDENGYTVYYSIAGPDHVSFSLGDSQGRPLRKLSDQAVGFDGFDLKAQALVSSGLWVAEYKNKPVPRVSGADIRQAQTLLVETGWRYETRTLPELAVEVPLQ